MSIINKKNVFWNSFSFIFISIFGFINFTLNLKTYSNDVFGYYILLSSYWGIGSSIDLGFGISTIKNISEAIKVKDYLRIKNIINTFFVTFAILGISVGSVIYGVFLFFSKSVEYNSVSQYDTSHLFLLFGIGFLMRYLSGFMATVYEGFSEFVLLAKINIVFTFLNTAMISVIYLYKLSLYYLVTSQFIYALLLFVVLFLFLAFKNEYVKFSFKYFNFKLLKSQGMYNLNIQLSLTFASFIDPIMKSILSVSLGLQFVTYFETAKKIINLTHGLIHSALKGMMNKISEANAVGELKQFVNDKIYIYSNLSLDYSVLVYGILNPLVCTLILIWFRNYESMVIFLIFLLPYSLINFGGPLYSVFFIEGKGGKLVFLQSINLVFISVVLYASIVIANSYLGLIGFYFATIINSFLMFYFLKKHIGFEASLFWSKIKLKNLISINILIVCQIILCILFRGEVYYLLVVFTLIYAMIFRYQLFYYSRYFFDKMKLLGNKK